MSHSIRDSIRKQTSDSQVPSMYVCTGWPNKLRQFLYALTLPNIKRLSKLFYCQNQEKICYKDPTTPQVCRYTTLWNVSVLKATIENIGQWCRRLECVIQQQGGHIEHLM